LTRHFFVAVKILTRMAAFWSAEDSATARVAKAVIALAERDFASPMEAEAFLELDVIAPHKSSPGKFDLGTTTLHFLGLVKRLLAYDLLRNDEFETDGRVVARSFALGGQFEATNVPLPDLILVQSIPATFTDRRASVPKHPYEFSFGGARSVFGPSFSAFGAASFFLHVSGQALWISAPPTKHNLMELSRIYSPSSRTAPSGAIQFLNSAESVQYRCMRDQEAVFFPPNTILIIVGNHPYIRARICFMRSCDVENCADIFSALTEWKVCMHAQVYSEVTKEIRGAAKKLHSIASTHFEEKPDLPSRLGTSLDALARLKTLR
jgi:hypothetical protein